jgi:polysaccharide export outer membrane protein
LEQRVAVLVGAALILSACGRMSSHNPAQAPNDPAAAAILNAKNGTSQVPSTPTQDSASTVALNNKLLRRASTASNPADLPLGPGDLIEITVFEVPELSGLKVRVTRPGIVVLPLLGEVPVAGKTPGELETNLRQRLAQSYMYDPHVTVFVHERTSQRVSVIGAVRKGGVFELTGRLRLADALGLAQGLADDADHVVYLFRRVPAGTIARVESGTQDPTKSSVTRSDGTPRNGTTPSRTKPTGTTQAGATQPGATQSSTAQPGATSDGATSSRTTSSASTPPSAEDPGGTEEIMTAINLDAIANGSEDLNVILESGDVIQVPRAGSIYVGGQVAKPGSIVLRTNTTVHQAIVAAGGATNVAALSDVRLYRTQPDGQIKVIPLDMNDFEAGKGSPEVERNDVVIVGRSVVKSFFWGIYDLVRGMFGFGFAL